MKTEDNDAKTRTEVEGGQNDAHSSGADQSSRTNGNVLNEPGTSSKQNAERTDKSPPLPEGEELETQEMKVAERNSCLNYEKRREEYEETKINFKETASRTILQMLEMQHLMDIHAGVRKELKFPVDSREGLLRRDLENKLLELEKQFKLVGSRIAESRREHTHRMTQMDNLENSLFRSEEEDFIKEIIDKVPTQSDLEKIKELRNVMMEKRRLDKEIRLLQMEIKAINKAMANADLIISECSAIKKPRRVVIVAEPEMYTPSSVHLNSSEMSVIVEKVSWESEEAGPNVGDDNQPSEGWSGENNEVDGSGIKSDGETEKGPPHLSKTSRSKR